LSFDPLYAFVFAGLFSPGPNVLLITASGARFGFRRTLPHVAGVVLGVSITAGLTGMGIGTLLVRMPTLTFALKLVAAGWILWMAWKLFASTRRPEVRARDRPFRFHEAVLFQWVNPKVWAVALAASTGYASSLPPLQEGLRIGSAFGGLNLFVCLFWATAGALLVYLLTTPQAWRIFTTAMAALLALAAGMVFI
jgi:threonine/homoserine/homoserine lactone efflux protein